MAAPGASRASGGWWPLPVPVQAVAIHAHSLEPRHESSRSEALAEEYERILDDRLPLAVGDTVTCLEEYIDPDTQSSLWLRGYVETMSQKEAVRATPARASVTNLLDIEWFAHNESPGRVGIFPASFVATFPDTTTLPQDTLMDQFAAQNLFPAQHTSEHAQLPRHRRAGRPMGMEPVKEVDEADLGLPKAVADRIDVRAPPGHDSGLGDRTQDYEKQGKKFGTSGLRLGLPGRVRPSQSLEDEAASTLQEWLIRTQKLFSSRQYSAFEALTKAGSDVHTSVMRIRSSTVRAAERSDARRQLVALLAKTEVACGLPIIARDSNNGQVLGYDANLHGDSWTTVPRLYLRQASEHLHPDTRRGTGGEMDRTSSLDSLIAAISPEHGRRQADPRYHLQVRVENFALGDKAQTEGVMMLFSLYSKAQGQFLSEEYGWSLETAKCSEMALNDDGAIFVDLSEHDIFDQVFLICRIVSSGDIQNASRSNSIGLDQEGHPQNSHRGSRRKPTHRSPIGCAGLMLDLTVRESLDSLHFSTLHEDLINNRVKKLASPTCPAVVTVELRLKKRIDAAYTSTQDSVTIRTMLQSTDLTQDPSIAKLLQADSAGLNREALIADIQFSDNSEICKFLTKILDAIFQVCANLAEGDDQLGDTVFNTLVYVLNAASDRRFKEFESTVHTYIQSRVDCSAAAAQILKSTKNLIDDSNRVTSTEMRSSIKVWAYLLELVERGWRTTDDLRKKALAIGLDRMLQSICAMMRMRSPPQIVGTQALALQHWPTVLPFLNKMIAETEFTDHVISFLEQGDVTKDLSALRLAAIGQVIIGPSFVSPASRASLVPALARWLKPALTRFDEHLQCSPKDSQQVKDATRLKWMEVQRLSISVTAYALDRIQLSLADPAVLSDRSLYGQEQDNIEYMLSLLSKTCECIGEFRQASTLVAAYKGQSLAAGRFNTTRLLPLSIPFSPRSPMSIDQLLKADAGVSDAVCATLAILQTASVKVLTNWLDAMLEVEGRDNLARVFSNVFKTLRSLLALEVTTDQWFNMLVLVHHVTLKFSSVSADFLERDFIPSQHDLEPNEFKTGVWRNFFDLLLQLANSRILNVECLTTSERRALQTLLGDVRSEIAFKIRRMWNALGWPMGQAGLDRYRTGGFQVQFIPQLVGGVLSLCLQDNVDLRRAGTSILGTIFVSEFQLNGNIRAIETEIVDRLDDLVLRQMVSSVGARPTFLVDLRDALKQFRLEPVLEEAINAFLDSLDDFLDLLMTLKSLPSGEEWHDERVSATLNLLRYLDRIGKPEPLFCYLHKLINHEILQGNMVQAGMLLRLCANKYEWRLDRVLEADAEGSLPVQTPFHRRQQLYLRAIDLLTRGGAWEVANELCKELQLQVEMNTYDEAIVEQTSSIHVQLFSKMINQNRPKGLFFRVAFYGSSFPAAIAGKQYVYKTTKETDLAQFVRRMLSKHPKALLLRTSTVPGDDIQYADAQYLQITEVLPVADERQTVSPLSPDTIREYCQANGTARFSFSRQFTRGDDDLRLLGDDSIARTWYEETTLLCESAFPGISDRAEVVELQILEFSPVESAINKLQAQERHLRSLEARQRVRGNSARSRSELDTSELAIALNEAIDPPSMRGHLAYRRALLRPQFLASYPDEQKAIERLRHTLHELAVCIAECLNLLAVLSTPAERGFQRQLQRMFESNFVAELESVPPQPDLTLHFTNLEARDDGANLDRENAQTVRPHSPTSLRTKSKSGIAGDSSRSTRDMPPATPRRLSSAASIISDGADGKSAFSRRSSLLGSLRGEGGRRSSALLDMLKRRSSAVDE
ncbi:Deoxycytidine kinase 1 [Microbotryomycetes sp. JL201]|nr:Deoxycytidine kinase 1 [Microbotryomycetes sp. JL201]